MKTYLKILFAAILIFPFCSLTMGQSLKGKFIVGGDSKINFTSVTSKYKSDQVNDDEGVTETSFGIAPSLGYFVTSGLALGLELPLNVAASKNNSHNSKGLQTSIAAAPFVRYYFGTKNVKPFFHGDFGLGSLKYKSESDGYSHEYTTGIFLYDIGAGLGIFINEHCAFDLGLIYSHLSYKDKDDNPDNGRDVISGVKFDVGISVFF